MPEEEGRKVLTVAELTRDIKSALESGFSGVWVEGEISNYKVYTSGHVYFTLKDDQAQIRAVMWKGKRAHLKFEPKDGDHVVCRGRVSVFEKRGEYQVVVEAMEPKGLGALQAAFEQLKKKLAAEGFFDEARKRPLPYIPWSVGIVTSPKGAVIRDMVRTINRRFPGLRIVLAPVRVQGDGAAGKIASAIADMNEYGQVDVIIVGRGGGSLEDLWAFNEEPVARAIFASKIPVVSAVGHETDFTIADFVADLRASTPTAAAEQIAPEREAVEESLGESLKSMTIELRDMTEGYARQTDDLSDRAARALASTTRHFRERLSGAARHLKALSPAVTLKNQKASLANLMKGMSASLSRTGKNKRSESAAMVNRLFAIQPGRNVARLRDALERRFFALNERTRAIMSDRRARARLVSGRLEAVSPLAVLERGYSIVTSPDGKVIYKSVKSLSPGMGVKIRMADGDVPASIGGKKADRQEKLF